MMQQHNQKRQTTAYNFGPMAAMETSLDLEEMDAEDRAELEAMLYAQVHHSADSTAADDAEDAAAAAADNSVEAGGSRRGFRAACDAVEDGLRSVPAVETGQGGIKERKQTGEVSTCADHSVKGIDELNTQSDIVQADSTGDTNMPSASSVSVLKPGKATSHSQSSSTQRPEPSLKTSVSGPSVAHAREVVDVSASSPDAFETKTSALAASERLRSQRLSEQAAITIRSSSESDEDDHLVVDISASPAVAAVVPEADKVKGSAEQRGDTGRSTRSSPDVVELAPSPASQAASATTSSSGRKRTIELAGDSSSDSETSLASLASTSPADGSDQAVADAAPAGVSKKLTFPRRARSQGAVLTPAPARPGQRPRTSSNLSSSESEEEAGDTLTDISCNIEMNVVDPSNTLAAQRKRREEMEGNDPIITEIEDPDSTLQLPGPKCRIIQEQCRPEDLPFLQELQRLPVCQKWSVSQREAYSTPRQYGLEDVDDFLSRLPDDGWEIPASYLNRTSYKLSARARYYRAEQGPRCRRCDREGHMQSRCPLPPVCHLCGGVGHSGVHRCPNMFCYSCGSEDHLEQRCPRVVQPVFCALCKAKGHVSDMCPDKWRRFHVTTPPALDQRPRSRQQCWQCGRTGHPGHHCQGDRFSGLASLSQQLISYTAAVCPSSSIPGLVATPAQMDAVFGRRNRDSIEKQSGATLTYEELGRGSWLINISGSLESAQKARSLVLEVMEGGPRSRPRPQSAPSSPVHVAEEGRHPGSVPTSPQRKEEDEEESKRELKKRRRKEKKKEVRRKRKLKALEDEAKADSIQCLDAMEGTSRLDPAPASNGEASNDVQVLEEAITLMSPPVSKPKKPRLQPHSQIELITVVSDDEASPSAKSAAQDVEVIEISSSRVQDVDATARVWRLNMPQGSAEEHTPDQRVRGKAHKQLRQMRAAILSKLTSPAASEVEEESCSSGEAVVVVSSSDMEPAGGQTEPKLKKKASKGKGKSMKGAVEPGVSVNCINGSGKHETAAKEERLQPTRKKQRKAEKASRLAILEANFPPNYEPPPIEQTPKPKKRATSISRCYTTKKLEKLVAAQGTSTPAVRKLKRLLNKQRKKSMDHQSAGASSRQQNR